MPDQSRELRCPICQRESPALETLSQEINRARTLKAKVGFAQRLLEKVQAVTEEHGPEGGQETRACLLILGLRKQVAELILRARGLAEKG